LMIFDTIEVMEAESQAVLTTLTECDFQGAFKNGRSARNSTCVRMMVASRPNVNFWSDGSTSPWNYGWLFVKYVIFLYNFCAKFLCCDKCGKICTETHTMFI
jgi:hypothetical protein